MSKILINLPRKGLRFLVAPACAALMALIAPGLSAIAQETHLVVSGAAYGATRAVVLEVNKSMLIDLPAGVAEVIISQPTVAAAIMRTRTRAILQGVEAGSTNVFFLDDAGRTISVLDLRIIQPPSEIGRALEATLARVIPGSNIKVDSVSDGAIDGKTHFVLTGTVLTAEDKATAGALAADISDEPESNPAGLLQVIGPQQVMLQVTVSEVKRDIAKQFGINLSGSLSVGNVNLGFNNSVTGLGGLTTSNGLNASGIGLGDLNITAAIRALETRGGLRVLAQPTLTAISGQEANFLAGGEIPYGTTDALGNRTVIFRPYGVELSFTPVVKANGLIALTVDTSVSEPQTSGALTKREANTSVELQAGTTLAIGGLLQEASRQQIDQLPGLGNIPILGALFRSRDFQTEQTELVILVTPYFVSPSPANSIPVPTDTATIASDAEAIFLGRLENMYGVAGSGEFRGSISGSVGFVLD
ncbi:type II and III secretion system protein family protein [Devosia lacusdianchii]|uniref:type II and III secretion system protein family protein n=1 Tax=Devosia lacusdianchii TaxID=2917991 RepID=UPI001F05CC78|nr:type II and III secretion system protein family protein [Devosia sp. JXJ CY 41]